jgi:hypothetical protein
LIWEQLNFTALTTTATTASPIINITVMRKVSVITETELRRNPYYYKYYYVYLNALFASIVPLLTLLYLNISTVRALR